MENWQDFPRCSIIWQQLLAPYTGVDLEPDFLGVSRTPKLENLGVRQKICLAAPAEEQIVGSDFWESRSPF